MASPRGRKWGKSFEEIADEVICDMHQAEEEEEGQRSMGVTEEGGTSQPVPRVNNENPYKGFMQEMNDLTRTDHEVDAEEDEWRKNMEEKVDAMVAKVDALVMEMAEQHAQTTRLVNLVERVVSWMDRETQSSNHPSPVTLVAPLAGSQQPNADNAGPSGMRPPPPATRLLE